MLSFSYRKLVSSLFRSSRRKPYGRPRVGEYSQRRSPLWLEALETRLAPAALTQSTGGVLTLALASGNTIGISGTASHLTFTIVSTTMTFTNSSSDTSYAFAASTTGNPVGSTSSAINGTNGPTLTALIISDAGSTADAIQFGFAGTGCTLPAGTTLLVDNSANLTTYLNNNVNTGTGSQTYNNRITINGNSTLTGSTVAFASTINDSPANTHNLTITGNASFGGTVGSTPLNSLSVSGTTSINTASITTKGSQTYSHAVTLGAPSVTLTSSAPGTITFGSTIAGAGDSLTIQNSSGVTLGGAIGSSGNALNALTVKSTGALSINQNIFATSVSFNSDTGNASGGDLTVASAITIQADTQSYKAGSNSASGSSVVDFSGALDGTFANTLGSGNPVSFTVSQDGALNGSEPANTQYFSSTLTGMNLTLESPNGVNPGTAANVAATNLTLLSSDTIFLQTDYTLNSLIATARAISPTNNAVITTTAGGQTYTGQVTLTTDATFTAAGAGTSGTITISGGVDNNAGSNVTLNVAGSATAIVNNSISGVISDQTGSPIVTTGLNVASGTLVLNGVSTYSGNTNISNGATLTFGALGSLSSAAPFTNVSTNATGIFDLAGTGQDVGTLTGSGTVRSTGGAGAVIIQNTCTFDGVIQDGTGTTSLSVAGGTFTLSGANTYSGSTTIGNGSTLTFSGTGSLHGAATFTDVNTTTSGTLDVAGTSQSVGRLSGSGTVKSTGGGGAVTIESTSTFAGELTNGTGGTLSVSVEGSGTTLTLSGTSNDYSGQTIVSDGCLLKVGAANATSANSAVTLDGTGTLDLNGFGALIHGLSDDAAGNAIVTNSSATTAATLTLQGTGSNFTGAIHGGTSAATSLTVNLASGVLNLTNATLSIGTFTLTAGTVTAPNSTHSFKVSGDWTNNGGTFTANGGTVDFTDSATQTLDSNGQSFNNVSHTGAGALQLVNNPLTVGGNLTNGAGAGNFDALTNHLGVTVIGQATLGGSSFLAATLSIGGATAINTAAITTTGTQTYAGDVILGTGTTLTGTIVTLHNNLTLGTDAAHATDTLNVVGSFVLLDTSTLTSTFAGTGPGQFGHILVRGGNTTYGDATLAVNYSGFTPAAGDNFDIVSNGGSSLLQFANAPASGSANFGGVAYLTTYSGSAGGSDFILSDLTPQQRFVEALYHDELGRPGDLNSQVDAGFWVNLLNQGTATTAVVADRVVRSSEARDHLVKGWFQTYLGRAPLGGEELGWVSALLQGQTEEQVLSQILASDEFFADAQNLVATGTPQERYVEALYQLVLRRTGSGPEVAYWDRGLPQSGSAAVALGFLTSLEYRKDLFTSYYTTLLHRASDALGLQAWVSSNLDASQVRIGFEASPEFFLNGYAGLLPG